LHTIDSCAVRAVVASAGLPLAQRLRRKPQRVNASSDAAIAAAALLFILLRPGGFAPTAVMGAPHQ